MTSSAVYLCMGLLALDGVVDASSCLARRLEDCYLFFAVFWSYLKQLLMHVLYILILIPQFGVLNGKGKQLETVALTMINWRTLVSPSSLSSNWYPSAKCNRISADAILRSQIPNCEARPDYWWLHQVVPHWPLLLCWRRDQRILDVWLHLRKACSIPYCVHRCNLGLLLFCYFHPLWQPKQTYGFQRKYERSAAMG